MVSYAWVFEFRLYLEFESFLSAGGGMEQSSGIVAEPYLYLRACTPDLSTKSGDFALAIFRKNHEIRNVSPR